MPKAIQESASSIGRGWWLTGAIILFLIYFLSYLIGIGHYFRGMHLIFIAGAIVLLVIYFLQKDNKKAYKPNSPPKKMKIQHIFYIVGVLFIFASVWYFARTFINDLPDPIKLMLLIVSVVVTFIIAELLRGGER